LVRSFVRALLRGLKDALDDPELAFNTSKKYVEGLGRDPQKDEVQRKVLAETLKLWQTPVLGRTDPACGSDAASAHRYGAAEGEDSRRAVVHQSIRGRNQLKAL